MGKAIGGVKNDIRTLISAFRDMMAPSAEKETTAGKQALGWKP